MDIRKINGREKKTGFGLMQKGFSLTEIVMLFFTVAVIAAIIFPLKIIDINQAERIAKWKTYYSELSYCYDVMLNSEKEYINSLKEDIHKKSDDYFFVF